MGKEGNVVADDKVVSLDYTLKVDGRVVDTSEGREPIEFIQGQGQIIAGLEEKLYGLAVGEEKQVQVEAARGYGEIDPDAKVEIDRDDFPEEIPLRPGVEVTLRNQEGRSFKAWIQEVGEQNIRLDYNHPLAGKDLDFEVKVVSLRDATDEELAHGHVHDGHTHG